MKSESIKEPVLTSPVLLFSSIQAQTPVIDLCHVSRCRELKTGDGCDVLRGPSWLVREPRWLFEVRLGALWKGVMCCPSPVGSSTSLSFCGVTSLVTWSHSSPWSPCIDCGPQLGILELC